MAITKPKGTMDVFGAQAANWRYIEAQITKTAALFGLEEIRTPMFENVELFVRSVGETTDIVQKEMYTFNDAGGRTYALRPEGTAPAVRAYLENSLNNMPMPLKLYYVVHNFRAERPQKGRYREHVQFGTEYFGSYSAAADAELISVAYTFLKKVGIENLTLRINSIGDKECRERYNATLLAFLEEREEGLCELCKSRMKKNAMRVLDCKNAGCGEIVKKAPVPLDHLGQDAAAHFTELQEILTDIGVPFTVDKGIVRGIDYYTRTVFEFTSTDLGSQSTVCGGGRYDNLIESHGGAPTGAVGFGMGIERLLMILEAQGKLPPASQEVMVFVGNMGEAGAKKARQIVYELRENGISAVCDLAGRSVKAQMKYADKIGARYAIIIGDSEIESGKIVIKSMAGGEAGNVDVDGVVQFFVK